MSADQKICLGAVVGVHGIKGEVKVKSFTEADRNLDKYGTLTDQKGRSWNVKVTGHSKELLRVKIQGIDDRNAAKDLIGCRFYTQREKLPELKNENEFYQADLIGLEVRLNSGKKVGKVAGFYNFGAGDIIEIALDENKQQEMIPFNREYVPEINIEGGFIIVSSVSMIFDENEE